MRSAEDPGYGTITPSPKGPGFVRSAEDPGYGTIQPHGGDYGTIRPDGGDTGVITPKNEGPGFVRSALTGLKRQAQENPVAAAVVVVLGVEETSQKPVAVADHLQALVKLGVFTAAETNLIFSELADLNASGKRALSLSESNEAAVAQENQLSELTARYLLILGGQTL